MLRLRNQENSSESRRKKWSSCLSLLKRIRSQRRQVAWNGMIIDILIRFICLVIYITVLLIFQCPNRLYNAWGGPFPINRKEFHARLEMNYDRIDLEPFLSFNWRFFHSEYIQIELGKHMIEQDTENILRVCYHNLPYGKLLYTLNRVQKSTSDTSKMTVYVKIASEDQSYSQQRYSYHFQSFSMSTLKCILEQLSISSREYLNWREKSIYIKNIEEIYDRDPILFNKQVIKTCGILIGYLYRPTDEIMFLGYSYGRYQFGKNVRLFDTSSSYTPYITYLYIGLFICFLFEFASYLIGNINSMNNSSFSIVHSSIEQETRKFNPPSLDNLDDILVDITYPNNYHDRLFIVNRTYLIMFMIDLKEDNKIILRRFVDKPPLIIIPIETIKTIRRNHIILKNYPWNSQIEFPMDSSSHTFNPANWLHQRLMIISDQYRYNWEEEHRHPFFRIIQEEIRYQQHHYGNDINRIIDRITSASPRFIAQFRLSDRQMITEELVDTTCPICQDDFRLKPCFAQWPCPATHIFHFDCMLDVLRAGNTCPLCRFPAEPADLPNTETVP